MYNLHSGPFELIYIIAPANITDSYDVEGKIPILLSVVATLPHCFISKASVKPTTPTEVQS